jgi:hypothetical protein
LDALTITQKLTVAHTQAKFKFIALHPNLWARAESVAKIVMGKHSSKSLRAKARNRKSYKSYQIHM